MSGDGRPWIKEEAELAYRLHFVDGVQLAPLAEKLGRSPRAIAAKFQYMRNPHPSKGPVASRIMAIAAAARPPPAAVADRDRRYAAPRTVGQIQFGDPDHEQSALGQRERRSQQGGQNDQNKTALVGGVDRNKRQANAKLTSS